MNLFCGMNMFMNNGLNSYFTPFSGYSFNNFSFFNMPSFNFGWNVSPFNFGNFGNFWGGSTFNSYNNISIFNNFAMPAFNNCWNSFSYGDTFTRSSSTTKSKSTSGSSSGTGMSVLNKAMSYVGKVNSDAEGNRLFSPKNYKQTAWYKQKGRWGWCSDFATYCAAEALGSKYPSSMKTSSPAGLKAAAQHNDCWVNGWNSSAKPGDIILLPGKGDSGLHVAVIKSIDGNGKVTCVSGNCQNAVKISSYNTSSVKGFVSIDKLA